MTFGFRLFHMRTVTHAAVIGRLCQIAKERFDLPSCDLLRHVPEDAVLCMLRSCFAPSISSLCA